MGVKNIASEGLLDWSGKPLKAREPGSSSIAKPAAPVFEVGDRVEVTNFNSRKLPQRFAGARGEVTQVSNMCQALENYRGVLVRIDDAEDSVLLGDWFFSRSELVLEGDIDRESE